MVEFLVEGCVYALVALGLTTIYNATKVINFAQGEFLVLGAGLSYSFIVVLHWPVVAAILAAIAGAVVMAVICERLIMLPVTRSGSHYAWIITTLALSLILEAAFALYYNEAVLHPDPFVKGSITVFGAVVSAQQLLLIGATVVVGVSYGLFLKKTTFGRAVRATGFDSDTAQLMGISVRSVVVVSFIIGGVVTAIAGILISPLYFISPTSGLTYVMAGFVAMIVGGLGSVAGSVAGGLIVGLLYSVVSNLIDAEYSQIVVVGLLVAILIVRPQGVFRSPIAQAGAS